MKGKKPEKHHKKQWKNKILDVIVYKFDRAPNT